MFREIVFLVPWAPMYLFEGGLEREVDSRTLGEFWCSDIPAEDSLAKASSSLSLFGNWCSFLRVLHFLIKERVFSFFASSLMQLLPTLELVSFVDDPCAFVFLTSLDNWHFNYVVTSEHLSWNISLGVGRWQEREGTQESKLVKEVGWNLPCYSCIAPNFLPPHPQCERGWTVSELHLCWTLSSLLCWFRVVSLDRGLPEFKPLVRRCDLEQVNKLLASQLPYLRNGGYWGIKWNYPC